MHKIISIVTLSAALIYTQVSLGLSTSGSTTTGGLTHYPGTTPKVSAANDSATVTVDSTTLDPSVTIDVLANDINAATAVLNGGGLGQYGSLKNGINGGSLTYQVDLNKPAVQKLISTPGAEPLKDFFVYTAKAASPNENQSAQATIVINIVPGYIQPVKAYSIEETIVVENATATSAAGTTTAAAVKAGSVTGDLLKYNNNLSGSTDTALNFKS